MEAIRSADVSGGRWQWLVEMAPQSFESIPYMTRRWPLMRDRNALGEPLRCRGRAYEHGLGLHAAAKLVWKLDGGYARLRMEIGIDDSGGAWSDADVEIKRDGESATIRIDHLRHGETPRPVDLDVTGTRVLEITVGFGENGDIQDRVDLLDAALVRAAAP